jgi:hypothetical protein
MIAYIKEILEKIPHNNLLGYVCGLWIFAIIKLALSFVTGNIYLLSIIPILICIGSAILIGRTNKPFNKKKLILIILGGLTGLILVI